MITFDKEAALYSTYSTYKTFSTIECSKAAPELFNSEIISLGQENNYRDIIRQPHPTNHTGVKKWHN